MTMEQNVSFVMCLICHEFVVASLSICTCLLQYRKTMGSFIVFFLYCITYNSCKLGRFYMYFTNGVTSFFSYLMMMIGHCVGL